MQLEGLFVFCHVQTVFVGLGFVYELHLKCYVKSKITFSWFCIAHISLYDRFTMFLMTIKTMINFEPIATEQHLRTLRGKLYCMNTVLYHCWCTIAVWWDDCCVLRDIIYWRLYNDICIIKHVYLSMKFWIIETWIVTIK